MTKQQKAEKAEAIEDLKKWIKPGDTVYTILEHVSRSGMSRSIRVLVPYIEGETDHGSVKSFLDGCNKGSIGFIHPNHAVSLAIGARRSKRPNEGVTMGGCGMDMGFALVYELSHALYPSYPCLGKGKCPSSYHVNHRDTIRCEGTLVHNPDGPNTGSPCWNAKVWRGEVPVDRRNDYHNEAGTPELLAEMEASGRPFRDEDSSIDLPWRYVHVVQAEDGSIHVCPTCKGEGRLPNPEGPERFDLVHTDGYALRQRWL